MTALPGNFRDLNKPSPEYIRLAQERYVASASGIFRRGYRLGLKKIGYKFRDGYRVTVRIGRERHAYSGMIFAWIVSHGEYPLARVVPADGNDENCDINNLVMES